MRLLTIEINGSIEWAIEKDTPSSCPLSLLPGWALVNPLLYRNLETTKKLSLIPPGAFVTAIIGAQYLLHGGKLIFASIENRDDEDVLGFIEPTAHLIDWLRNLSKQPRLGRISEAQKISTRLIDELPPITFPSGHFDTRTRIHKYQLATTVTWKHLVQAASIPLVQKPPIFDTLLLDSIQAVLERDPRTSLLYAAIAMETAARSRLDEQYNVLLAEGDPNGSIRIINRKHVKDGTVTEDPIYEYLMRKQGFARLIHELPLYIFRKSLLVENQALYQDAKELYEVRNDFAHTGKPDQKRQSSKFELNARGALRGLKCVIDVFHWF